MVVDEFGEFITFHEDVGVLGWCSGLWTTVGFESVDADDLGTADVCPGWVRHDPDHEGKRGLLSADSPRPSPVAGKFSGHVGLGDRGEEPDLGARYEGLDVLVVLASLASDGLGKVGPNESLGMVNAFAEVANVLVVSSVANEVIRFWGAKDEVEGLGDVSAK